MDYFSGQRKFFLKRILERIGTVKCKAKWQIEIKLLLLKKDIQITWLVGIFCNLIIKSTTFLNISTNRSKYSLLVELHQIPTTRCAGGVNPSIAFANGRCKTRWCFGLQNS